MILVITILDNIYNNGLFVAPNSFSTIYRIILDEFIWNCIGFIYLYILSFIFFIRFNTINVYIYICNRTDFEFIHI